MTCNATVEDVFQEQHSYAVQHVFVPGLIYLYLANTPARVYKLLTIIYFWESLEFVISIFNDNWAESPADSLFLDIIMGVVGMLAAHQFRSVPNNALAATVHILLLAAASVITVEVPRFHDDIGLSYIIYCGTYVFTAFLFTTIDWTLFACLNMLIIAAGSTNFFQRDFERVPFYTLIAVPITSVLYFFVASRKSTKQILG